MSQWRRKTQRLSRAILLVVCRNMSSSSNIALLFFHFLLNDTSQLVQNLISMLLSKHGISLIFNSINVEPEIVTVALNDNWILFNVTFFWIFWHRVLVFLTAHAHWNHSWNIFISARFLSFYFWRVHAFLHPWVLQSGCLYPRMEVFSRFRSQGSRWVSYRSKKPIPVNVSPNRTCGTTLLSQELDHFVCLVLV